MATEEDLTLGGDCTMQYTEGVLQNCTFDPYIMLLNNISPIPLIKNISKEQKKKEKMPQGARLHIVPNAWVPRAALGF